ncbi:DUF4123 domain-containing protein [Massilia sp. CCM 8695]|uniref:DUF4123 domain-containing protein n=2 Tax=Massilia frigida TaxID=2609281 RepID=A0ABX0N9U9_9BURK|nr:DUF4123 domain-containing protein [Massilia frigida]
MMNDATRQALGRLLSEHSGTLYALYDAAADNSLLGDLQRDGVTHECLYSGTKAITLRNVAPYLIPCAQFQHDVPGFIDRVWQRGVTMLVESGAGCEALKVISLYTTQAPSSRSACNV